MRSWSAMILMGLLGLLGLSSLLDLAACAAPEADQPAAARPASQQLGQTEQPDFSDFSAQARASTDRLQKQLKQELSGAMSDHGSAGALNVCSQRATELTRQVGDETGVELKRVSLRHRNPANRASPGEASVLALMAARTDLADTMIIRDGAPMYMRAIRINASLCLQCHGMEEDLAPELLARLNELYPGDIATGFSEGDLRGAFVVRPLAERPPVAASEG